MSSVHLIILPGWGGTKETWKEFVEISKPHFASVTVIELPCFGNEPCPSEVWGVEQYANFAKEKIEKYKSDTVRHREELARRGDPDNDRPLDCFADARNDVSKFVILGHSFGGQVAVHLVARYPDICDALILTGAAVIRPKYTLKRAVFGAIAKAGKGICAIPGLGFLNRPLKKILYKTADSPDYEETTGIKREIYRTIIRQDQSQHLSAITIPTLVVWGEKDGYVPLRYGKRIASMINGAVFHTIPNGTHGLHHEKRQELLSNILAFITK